MSLRTTAAVAAVRLVNGTSRLTGRGSGTVAGGRAGLAIEPDLLQHLSSGRRVAIVSGTNGKTTTTALLRAALGAAGLSVASNTTGSNMPAGHVAALVEMPKSSLACLEVDEAYLDQLVRAARPEVVLLLNLSRDQLDRMSEVRMLAERWRRALSGIDATVVANADDPLIVHAAGTAPSVRWVAGGLEWRDDAGACPACLGAVRFDAVGPGWRCSGCDLRRPEPSWTIEGTLVDGPTGEVGLDLRLPGAFNLRNATMALAAAEAMGIPIASAAAAMGEVVDVAGRFVDRTVDGTPVRLMLAKNPAGWSALLDTVAHEAGAVVVSINARTADGADPSWLFDVDFSVLSGRVVVATGDRWRDLSVRLKYAGVAHRVESVPSAAVALAGSEEPGRVDVIGNYTAFRDLLEAS
jgi:UDP-N-acetylmuramyl tripeptide synthase